MNSIDPNQAAQMNSLQDFLSNKTVFELIRVQH